MEKWHWWSSFFKVYSCCSCMHDVPVAGFTCFMVGGTLSTCMQVFQGISCAVDASGGYYISPTPELQSACAGLVLQGWEPLSREGPNGRPLVQAMLATPQGGDGPGPEGQAALAQPTAAAGSGAEEGHGAVVVKQEPGAEGSRAAGVHQQSRGAGVQGGAPELIDLCSSSSDDEEEKGGSAEARAEELQQTHQEPWAPGQPLVQ